MKIKDLLEVSDECNEFCIDFKGKKSTYEDYYTHTELLNSEYLELEVLRFSTCNEGCIYLSVKTESDIIE